MSKVCPIKCENTTGVILAGGRSSRMGRDKALLTLGDKSFLERLADLLQELFPHVIVVSGREKKYEELGAPVFPDIILDCGPLGGMHAGLCYSNTDYAFVVPCDLPLVNAELIHYVVERAQGEATVVSFAEDIQPLCGLFRTQLRFKIQTWLSRGDYSVKRFLKSIRPTVVALQADFGKDGELLLKNINAPGDYFEILQNHSSIQD
ncbi:MAG: molybdenum cofactor guanylyltransferase [Ignavibacteriales bacterium]|nr:molybdenum cofactor guanylyltransferase [Ignavibacteriales bacterium]